MYIWFHSVLAWLGDVVTGPACYMLPFDGEREWRQPIWYEHHVLVLNRFSSIFFFTDSLQHRRTIITAIFELNSKCKHMVVYFRNKTYTAIKVNARATGICSLVPITEAEIKRNKKTLDSNYLILYTVLTPEILIFRKEHLLCGYKLIRIKSLM